MRLVFTTLLVSLFAAACSSTLPVQSRVSVFHELPTAFTAENSFVVLPWTDGQKGSLEFSTYAADVTRRLEAKGLVQAQPNSRPRYAVFFEYGIDNGRTETAAYSIPIWGVTGVSSSNTTGTITGAGNTATVNATTVNTPSYGVTGYSQGTVSNRVFGRFVDLDILELPADGGSPKRVYEGRLKSEGSCSALPSLMPIFLSAILDEFPGKSGAVRNVATPLEGDC